LSVVKSEFWKFGDTLSRTKKKLQEAAHSIDHAEVRTRVIERTLRRVEAGPSDNPVFPSPDDPSGE
jgi:DNA recombination protein RmuC